MMRRCIYFRFGGHQLKKKIENPKFNKVGIYKEISYELKAKGFDKTPEQCKTKMHTFKWKYRLIIANLKKSGKGRNVCKFYEKLDQMSDTRPANSPVKITKPMSIKKSPESDVDSYDSIDGESYNSDL